MGLAIHILKQVSGIKDLSVGEDYKDGFVNAEFAAALPLQPHNLPNLLNVFTRAMLQEPKIGC